jgi:sugar/nucleoside kinase (ribokinase family)
VKALFVGHSYIDVTFLSNVFPTGDEKAVAQDYAISFGGNAVTAGFCCAKLGISPDILATYADDWLGRMFFDMAIKYGITVHQRKVKESSLSFIMPKDGKRAIVRCRDDNDLHPFPPLNMDGCKALHLDGHQPDAALEYAKICRGKGILTSLDGGAVRSNTEELLNYIDVAVVSELMCEQMNFKPFEMLEYLKGRGVKIGGVTMGSNGFVWYDEQGKVNVLPAFNVPLSLIIDSNGAGDIFHGAYVYSYLSRPDAPWKEHFQFARGASTHAIQHLGNEASLPTLGDIATAMNTFKERPPTQF